jgi:hypothetical protein
MNHQLTLIQSLLDVTIPPLTSHLLIFPPDHFVINPKSHPLLSLSLSLSLNLVHYNFLNHPDFATFGHLDGRLRHLHHHLHFCPNLVHFTAL